MREAALSTVLKALRVVVPCILTACAATEFAYYTYNMRETNMQQFSNLLLTKVVAPMETRIVVTRAYLLARTQTPHESTTSSNVPCSFKCPEFKWLL